MARPAEVYHHFGLAVCSDWPLPLERMDVGSVRADVHICRGSVPIAGQMAWQSQIGQACTYYHADDHHILDLGTARFAITRDRVVVDADDNAISTLLVLFPVWAAVLSMRGRETLHGAVVERDARGLALFGAPGFGKSTGSLQLIDRGWRLVTDDLITFDDDGKVVPGPPFMRLRGDRADGRHVISDRAGKYRFAPAAADRPVELSSAVVLDERFTELRRLSGAEAVEILLTTSYNVFPANPLQSLIWLRTAARLAAAIAVYGAPPRSLTPDHLLDIAGGAT